MPGEAEPEAAVVGAFADGDSADDLVGVGFEAEGPVPFVAAFDGGEDDVLEVLISLVWSKYKEKL